MTILVTGAAGFIGFHTALRLLQRGERVVGIDSLNDYYDVTLKQRRVEMLQRLYGTAFTFLRTNFAVKATLSEALQGLRIEGVVHLGAQAGVRYARTHPEAYVESNIVGHANLLEYCRRNDSCRHMVYASSSSVYGSNVLPDTGFNVDQRVDSPRSLYAASKKSNELMSETYSYLYRLPQTGLRFFTVYGPWGRPDMAMWLFTKAILAGDPITVFDAGNMRRDFTYVDDIVSGVVACLDNPPPDDSRPKSGGSSSPHRIYNIGNHRSEHLLRMIELIELALQRKAIRTYAPMQQDDVRDTYADISAIQHDLGYVPSVSIDVGIPRFVDWYKSYHGIRA